MACLHLDSAAVACFQDVEECIYRGCEYMAFHLEDLDEK
jgi:hypothetical protein